jgi:hypothetical protein
MRVASSAGCHFIFRKTGSLISAALDGKTQICAGMAVAGKHGDESDFLFVRTRSRWLLDPSGLHGRPRDVRQPAGL